jgi:hypothetical protein
LRFSVDESTTSARLVQEEESRLSESRLLDSRLSKSRLSESRLSESRLSKETIYVVEEGSRLSGDQRGFGSAPELQPSRAQSDNSDSSPARKSEDRSPARKLSDSSPARKKNNQKYETDEEEAVSSKHPRYTTIPCIT